MNSQVPRPARRACLQALVPTLLWGVAPWILPSLARGAAFPQRPVRLIVPAAVGGVQDVQSRRLADRLTEIWSQPVVIENRPGALGAPALAALRQAPADGHTLIMGSVGFTIAPHMVKMDFDVLRDLAPVSKYTYGPLMLAAHPSLPADNLTELLALARNRREGLAVGGFTPGSLGHLAVLLLRNAAGVDAFHHIPYTGGSQQVVDLISGQIPLLFEFAAVLNPHLKERKIKGLALCSDRRLAVLPDLPTFEEQGLAGMRITGWQGLMVHSATPPDLVAALNVGLVKAMNHPEIRRATQADAGELGADSPGEFRDFIDAEQQRWGRLIREAGLQAKG